MFQTRVSLNTCIIITIQTMTHSEIFKPLCQREEKIMSLNKVQRNIENLASNLIFQTSLHATIRSAQDSHYRYLIKHNPFLTSSQRSLMYVAIWMFHWIFCIKIINFFKKRWSILLQEKTLHNKVISLCIVVFLHNCWLLNKIKAN